MTARDRERIRQLEKRFELSLDCGQTEAARAFVELLRHWGRRINLAGPALLEDPYPHLFEAFWACGQGLLEVRRYIDVGSGAGLPGLAFLLFRPTLEAILLEPRQKKALFLREAIRRLGLRARVHEGGFEGFPDWDQGQLVTLRGLRPTPPLLEKIHEGGLPWLWFHAGRAPGWRNFRLVRQLSIPASRERLISFFEAL